MWVTLSKFGEEAHKLSKWMNKYIPMGWPHSVDQKIHTRGPLRARVCVSANVLIFLSTVSILSFSLLVLWILCHVHGFYMQHMWCLYIQSMSFICIIYICIILMYWRSVCTVHGENVTTSLNRSSKKLNRNEDFQVKITAIRDSTSFPPRCISLSGGDDRTFWRLPSLKWQRQTQ